MSSHILLKKLGKLKRNQKAKPKENARLVLLLFLFFLSQGLEGSTAYGKSRLPETSEVMTPKTQKGESSPEGPGLGSDSSLDLELPV